jgi:hypothetical protein
MKGEKPPLPATNRKRIIDTAASMVYHWQVIDYRPSQGYFPYSQFS